MSATSRACSFLLALFLIPPVPGADGTPAASPVVVKARTRLEIPAFRSDLDVSADGRYAFYIEGTTSGTRLRRASLEDGSIITVTELDLGGGLYRVRALEQGGFILARQLGDMRSEWEIFRLAMASENPEALKLCPSATDGMILPSGSGRYFVTGVDYKCHRGDRECYADTLAIVSIESGECEHRMKVPIETVKEQGEERKYAAQVGLSWASGDVLTVSGAEPQPFALVRRKTGDWARKLGRLPDPISSREGRLIWPGHKLTLQGTDGTVSGVFDPFELLGSGAGNIEVHEREGRIVLLRTESRDRGVERLNVVIVDRPSRKK